MPPSPAAAPSPCRGLSLGCTRDGGTSLCPWHWRSSLAPRSRRHALRPLARQAGSRQVAVAAPQPQPQPPPNDTAASAPKWALGAGMLAVAAAALKLAWSFKRPADVPPPPPGETARGEFGAAAAAAAGTALQQPPTTTAAAVAAAALQPPPTTMAAPPPQPPSPAVEAALAAVKQAGDSLAGSSSAAAAAAAAAVGPVLLAGETAGVVDETPTMTLDQLRSTATELYMLIQQMELHLQELGADLSATLPESALRQLDELAGKLEEVEERLAGLKGRQADEAEVAAAEQAHADLQWRQFELLTERASDSERRSYRSLLFNLRTQRQLLRQVEAQEALRMRMQATEARIAALLAAEQRQLDGSKASPAEQLQQRQQEAAAAASKRLVGSRFDVADAQALAAAAATAAAAAAQAAPQAMAAAAAAAQAAQAAPTAEPVAASLQLRLAAAGASIPHPAKAATGGEDAFFVSEHGCGAVGVADGVGGWAAEGVDPSLYPRRLMAAAEEALDERSPEVLAQEGGAEAAAALLLGAAHERTHEPGSTTVLLGLLLPGGQLSVANLGDCGVKVVRAGRVAYASQVLEHQWNMPLQLSCPDYYDCGSRPADAEQALVQLAEGDVVVLGSDGLWDNLWEKQMLEAVLQEQQQAGGQALAERLALRLARTAHSQSCDPEFVSPFSVERQQRVAAAAAAAGMVLPMAGGKKDDVTAVVAVVRDDAA